MNKINYLLLTVVALMFSTPLIVAAELDDLDGASDSAVVVASDPIRQLDYAQLSDNTRKNISNALIDFHQGKYGDHRIVFPNLAHHLAKLADCVTPTIIELLNKRLFSGPRISSIGFELENAIVKGMAEYRFGVWLENGVHVLVAESTLLDYWKEEGCQVDIAYAYQGAESSLIIYSLANKIPSIHFPLVRITDENGNFFAEQLEKIRKGHEYFLAASTSVSASVSRS